MSEQFHPNMRDVYRKTPINLVGTYDGRWWGETATDRGWLRTYFGQPYLDDPVYSADGRWQRKRLDALGFQQIMRSVRPGETFEECER